MLAESENDNSEHEDSDKSAPAAPEFPVVAIGASAGGLEALKTLLDNVPPDSGMALVVIQHLAPDYPSLTDVLLEPHTQMQVKQATDGVELAANHIYVIPPNKYLAIEGQRLLLKKPVLERGIRMPIDYFLRSLASERRENAVGILLSGTGTDGTLGLREVKCAGGMAMAQDPDTAQYSGMVRSAIDAGLVDFVLPIKDIPKALLQYLSHLPKTAVALDESHHDGALQEILALIYQQSGYDFRGYKLGTLLRRIQRRMSLCHSVDMPQYIKYLRDNSSEIQSLYQDLLISVTGFFREPEAYDALLSKAVMPLIQKKNTGETIRVWVPGCATGEEAYSVAMLFSEQLAVHRKACELQIFATDIDEKALQVGRAGAYPESAMADMSAERIERFFTWEDSICKVRYSIREMVTFAKQNLIIDPPFSRIDLVSCRNLMIYLQPDMQRSIISLFHFALAPNGYILLGSSESTGTRKDLFEPLDKKWRLYRRLDAPRQHLPNFPPGSGNHKSFLAQQLKGVEKSPGQQAASLKQLAQQHLLAQFAPAAVVVDSQQEIKYYHGPIDRYLQRPAGAPTDNLSSQCRRGLRAKLNQALQQAARENTAVTVNNCRFQGPDDLLQQVRITVEVLSRSEPLGTLSIIVFEDDTPTLLAPDADRAGSSDGDQDELIRQLEHELRNYKQELSAAYEQFDSSTEELKSASEEIMSMNEEFQSTNEELESSKEELQSMNEELNTVNTELQSKVEELSSLNSDLHNLLASTDIATIFLDRRGLIKRFTPASRKLFNLIQSDLGRPINHIAQRFQNADLYSDALDVLDRLTPLEREVQSSEGCWYLQRVLPYLTEQHKVEGVVATFIDINERKLKELAVQRLATMVSDSNEAIIILNADSNIVEWNRGARVTYGWSSEQVLGKPIFAFVPDDRAEHERAVLEQLRQGTPVESYETSRLTRNDKRLDVWLTATAFRTSSGDLNIALTERDITERKRAEVALQKSRKSAEEASQRKSQFLAAISHDLRQPLQSLKLLNAALLNNVNHTKAMDLAQQQKTSLRVITDILDVLLDLNQIESGSIKIQVTQFSAQVLFRDLASEFADQAAAKGLQLRTRVPDVLISSDRKILGRIVANLIDNAIKYTTEGGILLAGRRRGDTLRIEVRDSGCGIPENELAAIFDEYYQGNNPQRDRRHGLGLGLSIASRLTRLLDSELLVRSVPDDGSVFSLRVPLAPDSGQRSRFNKSLNSNPSNKFNDNPEDTLNDSNTAESGRLPSNTLLLIEDDPLVANSLVQFLGLSDFRVRHFSSGETALAALLRGDFQPRLLLCDYRLPGQYSGLQIIGAIRKHLRERIPAILLTGDIHNVNKDEVHALGCEVLYKPIDPQKLIATIRQMGIA